MVNCNVIMSMLHHHIYTIYEGRTQFTSCRRCTMSVVLIAEQPKHYPSNQFHANTFVFSRSRNLNFDFDNPDKPS